MKTFKYIMLLALACSLTTSCMDGDWDTPEDRLKVAERITA